MSIKHKLPILLLVMAAILAMPFSAARADNSADYPVLLVYGLGSDSADTTFGNLQDYLETWFFDVEAMDFGNYRGHGLAKNAKKKAELTSLAAILKVEIDKVKKKYNAKKVNIIAHSYGGLIVHSYIMGLGSEARKSADYEDDVNRVLYIQTPFFGREEKVNMGKFGKLLDATDFSVFTDKDKLERDLQPGSDYLVQLFAAMEGDNVYEVEGGVTAGFFVSESDDFIPMDSGTLRGDVRLISGEYEPNRIFTNYPHSSYYNTADAKKFDSIAYVEEMTDENFAAIASFIDGGTRWLRMGEGEFKDNSFITVNVLDEANASAFNKTNVWLILTKKASQAGLNLDDNMVVNKRYNGYFNKDNRSYYFTGLVPGEYEVHINNPNKKKIIEFYTVDARVRKSLDYSPKDNAVVGGVGNIPGLLVLPEFTITEELKPYAEFHVKGVNTDGFFVEFEVTGVNKPGVMSDRNVLFEIINDDSPAEVVHNGARIRLCGRGHIDRTPGPAPHMNKIQVNAVVDKNRNGISDDDEWFEEKTHHPVGDWMGTLKVRFEVRTVNGECHMKIWVNDKFYEPTMTKSKPYFNPNFKIAVGGGFAEELGKYIDSHPDHPVPQPFYEYRAPVGAVFHYFRVGNIGQHK